MKFVNATAQFQNGFKSVREYSLLSNKLFLRKLNLKNSFLN